MGRRSERRRGLASRRERARRGSRWNGKDLPRRVSSVRALCMCVHDIRLHDLSIIIVYQLNVLSYLFLFFYFPKFLVTHSVYSRTSNSTFFSYIDQHH